MFAHIPSVASRALFLSLVRPFQWYTAFPRIHQQRKPVPRTASCHWKGEFINIPVCFSTTHFQGIERQQGRLAGDCCPVGVRSPQTNALIQRMGSQNNWSRQYVCRSFSNKTLTLKKISPPPRPRPFTSREKQKEPDHSLSLYFPSPPLTADKEGHRSHLAIL